MRTTLSITALLLAPAAAWLTRWVEPEAVVLGSLAAGALLWEGYRQATHRRARQLAAKVVSPTAARPPGESPLAAAIAWADPGRAALDALEAVVAGVRDDDYRRAQAKLRLVGLNEIWRGLARAERPEELFGAVLDFLHRDGGRVEMALLRLDPLAQELVGTWASPDADGRPQTRSVRWALAGIGGSVARVIRTARPARDLESGKEPLLTVHGEAPRPRPVGDRHTVLPLLVPSTRPECLEQGWLYRPGCPAYRAHPVEASRGRPGPERRGLGLEPCGGCQHFPLRGVLLATDAGAERVRGDREPLLLDSVADTVAAVLEHAGLYRDVKVAERFRDEMFDAMLNGLLSTDPHGRIVFANRRARELSGCGDELLGRSLEAVVDLPGSNALRRTLLEGIPFLHGDALLNARTDDGAEKLVPVRVNLTPFRTESGAMKGAVCVLEDQSHLRAMQEEIRHLDTLAAVGRFASSLAHEIRNPLGGIRAGIGFLGRSPRLDDDDRENLAVMDTEIDRLDGILRNLLAVARPREIHLEPAEPRELAERTLKTLEPLADNNQVRLCLSSAAAVGTIHLDRDMIHQVLLNLVKNALEASSRGSTVEIVVEAAGDPSGGGSSEGARWSVLDRGPGIAEADPPHLFEPFFSRKSEGTGLGLYVCHSFAQRHGGTLRAKNRTGGGASFTLWLPAVPALMGGRHETSDSGRR